jgi:hypothetical protein
MIPAAERASSERRGCGTGLPGMKAEPEPGRRSSESCKKDLNRMHLIAISKVFSEGEKFGGEEVLQATGSSL